MVHDILLTYGHWHYFNSNSFQSCKPLAGTHTVVKWGTCTHKVCAVIFESWLCLLLNTFVNLFSSHKTVSKLHCSHIFHLWYCYSVVFPKLTWLTHLTNFCLFKNALLRCKGNSCPLYFKITDPIFCLSRRAVWMWRLWSRHTGGTPSWDIPSILCTPLFYLCPTEMLASTVSFLACSYCLQAIAVDLGQNEIHYLHCLV